MKLKTRITLSAMMFLQFFIWGAWFVTLGTFLGKGLSLDGAAIGAAYSTMPWGALIAPFFVGMIADRFFNSEKVLAACHLLGAVLLYYASTLTDANLLFWVLLAYALAYNPTLALVNAISFNQIEDPGKQFPAIRVFGTIGWIVAGLIVGSLGIEATSQPMQIAAGVSVLLAILALFLPKTPPKKTKGAVTVKDILGLDALSMLKDRSFAIFTLGSLLICIPLAFYYNFTNLFLNDIGIENAAGKMTLGQVSEIIFMLVMPFFFIRLGVKKMLIAGMIAWALRYVLFAFGDSEGAVYMLYLGILLHGICYDFFFVTGQIYVDNSAPSAIRASAQGFITLITYGLGMLIGAWASGLVVKAFETTDAAGEISRNWETIWLVPAGMAGIIIVIFALLFKDPPAKEVS
ncbi:MAG: nucleoside permease [Verrucomicrobiota bacterium]